MDVSESQTKDITLEEIVTKTAGFSSTKSSRTKEVTKDIDKKETEYNCQDCDFQANTNHILINHIKETY